MIANNFRQHLDDWASTMLGRLCEPFPSSCRCCESGWIIALVTRNWVLGIGPSRIVRRQRWMIWVFWLIGRLYCNIAMRGCAILLVSVLDERGWGWEAAVFRLWRGDVVQLAVSQRLLVWVVGSGIREFKYLWGEANLTHSLKFNTDVLFKNARGMSMPKWREPRKFSMSFH